MRERKEKRPVARIQVTFAGVAARNKRGGGGLTKKEGGAQFAEEMFSSVSKNGVPSLDLSEARKRGRHKEGKIPIKRGGTPFSPHQTLNEGKSQGGGEEGNPRE